MKRREFISGLAAAGAWLGTRPRRAQAQSVAATSPRDLPPAAGHFPAGDYTPYGYLDNPFHSWDLHRSGVLRSVEAIGFGFYYPAGPGGYFDYRDSAIYQMLLRVGAVIEGQPFLDAADFAPGQLTAPHHSHNLFTFAFEAQQTRLEASFLQVDENTLAARVRLRNLGGAPRHITLIGAHTYHLGAQRWWGRDGLAGTAEHAGGAVTTRSFAAGEVCRLACSEASAAAHVSAKDGAARAFLLGGAASAEAVSYFPAPLYAALRTELTLAPGGSEDLWFWLTRAANLPQVRARERRARAAASATLGERAGDDDRFWALAPRLEGDWPAHWRRGWVYDFETLRMNVRHPLGVYHHPWDGMQIQAPRNVLAETSLDMWALSYADPATAETVLAGQFADALETNVPCMRESGVMNMVAADGSACGTSIAWCYPLFCMQSVARRTGNRAWRAQLYEPVAAFVRWTLAHRTDRAGYVVGKCSWETGMDASSRFLIAQPTGAELIDFIRVVELQAATAHACGWLAALANEQGNAASAAEWRALEHQYTARTQSLWNGHDWFQDFNTRDGKPIVLHNPPTGQLGREVGQCAPIFLGQATAAQMQAMRPLLREYRARPQYFLEWPSFVLPYIESLWTAGEHAFAAEVVRDIAERVYASTDRRQPGHDGLGWPGVSCEMWALKGALGGEGYGWGATLPAHILRSVVGFRETTDSLRLELSPNLPEELAQAGRSYAVRNLRLGSDRLDVRYDVRAGGEVRVTGTWAGGTRTVAAQGAALEASGRTFRFNVPNHTPVLLRLETA
ncbi:MAG: hypothetical protein EPN33_06140 [Acidobacteria bacterium]|nr:MAG: hypothetical protein EPN33_06140 [Acidobacteriota bacterium]